MYAFALLIFVLFTWFLWVLAAAAQVAVDCARRGLPRRGMSPAPIVPVMAVTLWSLSFVLPHGVVIIGLGHLFFLVILLISIAHSALFLRSFRSKSEIAIQKTMKAPVPAVVFGCLLHGELRITVHPGVGLADGGIPWNVPIELVPPELRLPNTKLWVQLNDRREIESITRRDE